MWDDNLLHFCTRHKLCKAALVLLQSHHIAGKVSYVVQRSSLDDKSPLELARRNGLTRAAEVAQSLVVSVSVYSWP